MKTWAAKKRKAPLCWQCCRALVSPKWYSATKEEQKMPPKWSSGRACGAASTTQRTCFARSNGEDGKEKGCTEGTKRPPRIMCVFSKHDFKNSQKWYTNRHQIIEMMLERFPLKLEACISWKSKPEHPHNSAERLPKRSHGRKGWPKGCPKGIRIH